MTISDTVSRLFKMKSVSTNTSSAINIASPDNKLQDETYVYYGTRICGKVTASLPVLNPFLLKIYNGEKQRQISDQQLQQQRRDKLNNDLTAKMGDIAQEKTNRDATESKIKGFNEELVELVSDLTDAKNKNGEVNKMARIKLWIGGVILMILTVYLFIFYSSTFYSAFFKDFTAEISIGAAMFDAKALPNAMTTGFGELVFILCAPVIFMGLGYALHFFMQSKSVVKYLKAGSVLLITLIFDCILAYLIGKKIYDIEALMSLNEMPPFNVDMAIVDPNFWAVIFCGFIVYLIWGIVFDMAMTAYEDLRSNKNEIEHIKEKINHVKLQLLNEQQQLSACDAKITKLESEKIIIEKTMAQSVYYDVHIIKAAMSDFFSGWMAMMNGLTRPSEEQEKAKIIYADTIEQLFNS